VEAVRETSVETARFQGGVIATTGSRSEATESLPGSQNKNR